MRKTITIEIDVEGPAEFVDGDVENWTLIESHSAVKVGKTTFGNFRRASPQQYCTNCDGNHARADCPIIAGALRQARRIISERNEMLQPATDQRRPATAEDAKGDEYEDQ